MAFYIFTKFIKISQRVYKFLSEHDIQTEMFQGAKFSKNVDRFHGDTHFETCP